LEGTVEYADFLTNAAAAAEDRAAERETAMSAWRAHRERELVADLETRPLLACMPGNYSTETQPPVAVEMVEWVMQTSGDAARTLAEAIYSPTARYRLHRLFASQAAEHECDMRPESAWEA
jgi:hypothetical protein